MRVEVSDGVCDFVCVCEGVWLAVRVILLVTEGVWVTLEVTEADWLALRDWVWDCVVLAVCDCDEVCVGV